MPKFDARLGIDTAAVIEAAAESILVTTNELEAPGPTILYVNPAFEKMTGWSSAAVVGMSPRILQGPKTDLRIFGDLREKLRSDGVWEGRTINYRKDGSEFWMEWSVVPLRDEQGNTYQYIAVQRDISARIEVERQLQEARAAQLVAERARANLSRYFSPRLVETLAAKDHPLGPVRRQNLAVLFADIVGFTNLSEAHEPEQVIEILRDMHSWIEAVIFKWNGSIESYTGDSVLAIFGFPETGEQDGTHALSCAYEMLAAANRWNRQRTAQDSFPVRIGIGVHYGPVVLGDVGTEEYVGFTVIGDTVNTASRLEQATRSLGCHLVVGQELVDAIKGEGNAANVANLLDKLQHYGEFVIRGRTQPVEVWTFSDAPEPI